MSGGRDPTPFLYELLDLLQLAFPRPVVGATADFGPNDDGSRSVLKNLEGQADSAAPARPDLGYTDEDVLDTLNAVVGDVVRAAGIAPAHTGQIAFRPATSEVKPEVVQAAADDAHAIEAQILIDGEVFYRRRISESERYHLIHTPALFGALNGTLDEELRVQTKLRQAIAGRTQFGLDVDALRLSFPPDGPVYGVQLLASYHDESRTFIWGWANEAFDPAFVARSDELRRRSTGFGLRALATPEVLCPPLMAERLARHAGVVLETVGVFKAAVPGPNGPVGLWLGLVGGPPSVH